MTEGVDASGNCSELVAHAVQACSTGVGAKTKTLLDQVRLGLCRGDLPPSTLER